MEVYKSFNLCTFHLFHDHDHDLDLTGCRAARGDIAMGELEL
jgi:hypothetical protein